MAFNPSQGQWGDEVGNPNRPNLYVITGNPMSGNTSSQQGRAIGYACGVLRLLYGITSVTVEANPGPFFYNYADGQAMKAVKQWFHDNADPTIAVNTACDAKGKELLDVKVIFG